MTTEQAVEPSKTRRRARRVAIAGAALLVTYLGLAYIVVPMFWRRYERHHPWLDEAPGITLTKNGIPGDPLNVALVGDEAEVKAIMAAAGWDAAAALGLRSDLEIAVDTVLKRPDVDAPVSNLYLFGRKEDLAFEQPVGGNPRQRHHVRFWRCPNEDSSGRPAWIGSITYDERVGFSHTTGQITHHIAPDVDAERDRLFQQLQNTGKLAQTEIIDDFHPVREGRNGGGDPWRTDGRLFLGVIAAQ